jgi:hypothetical protein
LRAASSRPPPSRPCRRTPIRRPADEPGTATTLRPAVPPRRRVPRHRDGADHQQDPTNLVGLLDDDPPPVIGIQHEVQQTVKRCSCPTSRSACGTTGSLRPCPTSLELGLGLPSGRTRRRSCSTHRPRCCNRYRVSMRFYRINLRVGPAMEPGHGRCPLRCRTSSVRSTRSWQQASSPSTAIPTRNPALPSTAQDWPGAAVYQRWRRDRFSHAGSTRPHVRDT